MQLPKSALEECRRRLLSQEALNREITAKSLIVTGFANVLFAAFTTMFSEVEIILILLGFWVFFIMLSTYKISALGEWAQPDISKLGNLSNSGIAPDDIDFTLFNAYNRVIEENKKIIQKKNKLMNFIFILIIFELYTFIIYFIILFV